MLRGSDLTHIPEVQWPTLITKNKLTLTLKSLPVGSVPTRKGTTLLSNEGYSLPVASKFWAHPGMPKCNRLRAICISPHAMGFGWTLLFDWKGWFFPLLYSWCSAFSPNMDSQTNKLKPACIQTGWRLWETQKIILNTRCINHSHQGEGDPKRRVQRCSLPKPWVDVTPRSKSDLRPLSHCVSGKRSRKEPQTIIAYPFILHVKLGMTYIDDARIASSNITHHHDLWAWEQVVGNKWWGTSGGKLGTLANLRHVRAPLRNEKVKYPG